MALPAMTPTIREQLRPITFEEYRAMPDDGVRYELIDGALFEMPGRKKIHQYVVGELFVSLREFVRRKRSGIVLVAPFDVRLGPYTAVQPDLMYFSGTNPHASGPDFADGAPDLVIEVLSPSTRS